MNLHVDTLIILRQNSLHGLRVLRAHGMSDDRIQEVFRSIVTAKLTYASQAWSGFCTPSDINKLDRFLTRCKRHNYCSQTIPSIDDAEQFDNADQSLFRTVLYMHNHVMHRLLPPKKRLQYKLRPRNHNLALTSRTSYCDSCNFITRMIFSDAYRLYICFYPRDAMLARVIVIATCLSVRPSVCPSRAGIVSKRRKLAA